MKIGLSTYSLLQAVKSGALAPPDLLDWIAARGGAHVEIVPIGFEVTDDMADQFRERAKHLKIEISNYLIAADFIKNDGAAYEREVERVLRQVDVAKRLGVSLMRHDVAWRPPADSSIWQFEEDLPRIVTACQRIADYAQSLGIVTTVENHGYFVQHSDRVLRLVQAVNRPNFRLTVDVGNFLCVDEDPVAAVQKCLPYAAMVHLKDFYVRYDQTSPGHGWFSTAGGHFLRGAMVGHGDVRLRDIVAAIKRAKYDGFVSVEFEGLEESRLASEEGLKNARALLEQS